MAKKYDIKTTDEVIKGVPISNYDAEKISKELNDLDKRTIAIGDGEDAVVVQRLSVIKITPSKDE